MKMNKRIAGIVLATAAAFGVAACGSADPAAESSSQQVTIKQEEIPVETTEEAAEEASTVEEAAETAATMPEGMYASELTGEPVSEDIKDQRPIAVMIDNDKRALPHYETADADIVYEMMNSTANNRITRFMCIRKDWGSIEQMGSIRSTRPTNLMLMGEYNAVLCHDGGPFYINDYLGYPWADHFSGTFARVQNGKAREFTEYIVPGDLDDNFKSSGYSKTYNDYRPERDTHFLFADYGTEFNLSDPDYYGSDAKKCTTIDLSAAFENNKPKLVYNPDTKTYDYYEYGEQHKDAETDKPLTFKNVLLQYDSFVQLDAGGYLSYNVVASGLAGYYFTNGEVIPVTWEKNDFTKITKFFDQKGNEIKLNTGKTYIGICPDDTFADIKLTND